MLNRQIFFKTILILIMGFSVSCNQAPKVEKVETPQEQVEAGKTVRLVGDNFGRDLTKLEVKVDDESTQVKIVDEHHIDVTVPDDVSAGSHKVVVVNKEKKVQSEPLELKVEIPSPQVTGIEPQSVRTGSVLKINGKHFNEAPGAMEATLGNERVSLTSVVATSAEVNVPERMDPGKYDVVLKDLKTGKKSAPQQVQVTQLVRIPAGSELHLKTVGEIGSNMSHTGDKVSLVLTAPLESDGVVIASGGNHVSGEVTFVDQPGRVKGKAAIGFTIREIDLDNHNSIAVQTNDFSSQAASGKKKDAKKILIGTGIGTFVGALAGGGKGAAIGAGVGAGAGTAVVLSTKGDHVLIPENSKLVFVLQNPLEVELTEPMSMAKMKN